MDEIVGWPIGCEMRSVAGFVFVAQKKAEAGKVGGDW